MNKNIFERLLSNTPVFFKKLRMIGILLTTISATLLGVESQVPGFNLSPALETAAQYLSVIGIVIAAISQTAVTNDKA